MNFANLSRHGLLQVLEEDKKGLAAIKHRIVSYMEDHDALRTAGQDESLGAIRERTSSLIAQHSALNEVFLERRAAHARQCLLPEILANVFRCAILDLEDSTEPPYRFAYDLSHETLPRNVPPMNVSQVCREWRQVALSTPALWTFICARPESELALRIAVTRTESWLVRSTASAHPLSLRVNLLASRSSIGDALTFSDEVRRLSWTFLQLLLQHSSRWSRATISHELSATLPLTFKDLPNLTNLTCYLTTPHSIEEFNPGAPKATVDLSTITNLQNLSLTGHFSIPTPVNAGNVLSNLVTLQLVSDLRIATAIQFAQDNPPPFPKGSDCLALLRVAPFLEEVRIDLGGEEPAEALHDVSPVTLERLTYAEFSFDRTRNSVSMSHLLRNINAPSLEFLILQDNPPLFAFGGQAQNVPVLVFSDIANFVARSKTLSSLVIRPLSAALQTALIEGVLRETPSLINLHIQTCYFQPDLLRALAQTTPNSHEFVLCPRLESIYFEEDDPSLRRWGMASSEENLALMVEVISRRRSVPLEERVLREAVINSSVAREGGVGDWESVRALVSGGLRFRVTPSTRL